MPKMSQAEFLRQVRAADPTSKDKTDAELMDNILLAKPEVRDSVELTSDITTPMQQEQESNMGMPGMWKRHPFAEQFMRGTTKTLPYLGAIGGSTFSPAGTAIGTGVGIGAQDLADQILGFSDTSPLKKGVDIGAGVGTSFAVPAIAEGLYDPRAAWQGAKSSIGGVASRGTNALLNKIMPSRRGINSLMSIIDRGTTPPVEAPVVARSAQPVSGAGRMGEVAEPSFINEGGGEIPTPSWYRRPNQVGATESDPLGKVSGTGFDPATTPPITFRGRPITIPAEPNATINPSSGTSVKPGAISSTSLEDWAARATPTITPPKPSIPSETQTGSIISPQSPITFRGKPITSSFPNEPANLPRAAETQTGSQSGSGGFTPVRGSTGTSFPSHIEKPPPPPELPKTEVVEIPGNKFMSVNRGQSIEPMPKETVVQYANRLGIDTAKAEKLYIQMIAKRGK